MFYRESDVAANETSFLDYIFRNKTAREKQHRSCISLRSSKNRDWLRVLRLSFWDDVAVWSNMRSSVGALTVSETDQSRAFSPRNNKHVRKWYLTAARSGFYVLDTVRLRRVISSNLLGRIDVIIFDRYLYDQIANIYSPSPLYRLYCKTLLRGVPTPDLAFVLDASADAAFARKPEYPLEFVRQNRRNFLRLSELSPQIITVSPGGEDEVRKEIESWAHACLDLRCAEMKANEPHWGECQCKRQKQNSLRGSKDANNGGNSSDIQEMRDTKRRRSVDGTGIFKKELYTGST